MKAISFAWTLDDLLAGRKTATRRFWKDRYAKLFHERDLVVALNKDRRAGGKPVAVIRLTCDPYKQPLSQMTEADLAKEGTLWLSLDDFREEMFPQSKGATPWVLEFELVAVTMRLWPSGRARPLPRWQLAFAARIGLVA